MPFLIHAEARPTSRRRQPRPLGPERKRCGVVRAIAGLVNGAGKCRVGPAHPGVSFPYPHSSPTKVRHAIGGDDRAISVVYAEGVKRALRLMLVCGVAALPALAQDASRPPRFENFPANSVFKGKPADPVLVTPEERRYGTVIQRGLRKGLGVEDGESGRDLAKPGPNFAGNYVIVKWGCGSPCLMAAIVDSRNGRVLPPPFHHGPGHSYFQVPWGFPKEPPLSYRLDSRLLIANICEADKVRRVNGRLAYEAQRCGLHYFVIRGKGLTLIRSQLD